jgi:hypothetical protein
MNLVQKLPIGLSLACLMFMSSCSKEDALTPEPQMESVNAHSSLRDGTGPTAYLPIFPSTFGATGVDIYPTGWKRVVIPSNGSHLGTPSVAAFPTGVSNRTHAFGIANQWIKPLPAIPSALGANSFVTFVTNSSEFDIAKRVDVAAKIKHLVVGQKYSIEFYIATTSIGGPGSGYAKRIIADVGYPNYFVDIDLTGKKAEWIKASFVFKARYQEETFSIGAASENNTFAYAHVFVDQNSIKKVL